jgi:YggT family protein
MRALFDIANLIVQTFFGLFLFVLLARFWMQVFRASFRNPVGGMVLALSDWIVLPARRVVPQFAGLDLSTALCAWIVEIVQLYALLLLREALVGSSIEPSVPAMLLFALLELMRYSILLLIGIVLLQILVSWINPYSTIGPALSPIVRRLCRPFQRLLRPVSGIDLSPIFLLLVLFIGVIILAEELGPFVLKTL